MLMEEGIEKGGGNRKFCEKAVREDQAIKPVRREEIF